MLAQCSDLRSQNNPTGNEQQTAHAIQYFHLLDYSGTPSNTPLQFMNSLIDPYYNLTFQPNEPTLSPLTSVRR